MNGSSQSWLSLADEFATRQNISEANTSILRAFGGEDCHEVDGGSFETVESNFETFFTELSQSIVDLLSQEVDRDQAENFARRFEGVRSLTLRLGEQNPVGRLFQFGLAHRMKEILDESKNLALRVRAVNDFYYSHVSVALHQIQSPECKSVTLASLLPTINWTSLTEKLTWGHLQGMTQNGPVNINFLKARAPNLETIHCAKHCASQTTFVDVVRSKKAIAGVSGGFFLYSEPDIAPPSKRTDPVGLLIHQGNVVNLPIFHRSSLLQLSTGKTLITALGMEGATLSLADKRFTLTRTNTAQFIDREAVSFNRAFGSHAPPHLGATVLVEANQVLRVVDGQTCPAIPLAGCAITLPWLQANLVAASELALELDSFPYGDSTIIEGMAGGPLLVTNGQVEIHRDREDFVLSAPPITFSQDETFDQNLLPRMAVGQLDDDQLLFAAIDGRNIEHAVGLTLEEAAHLMKAMGCHTAMNLDGGSSKRMVIQNRAVDLASTEVQTSTDASEKVRPVYSAILLHE